MPPSSLLYFPLYPVFYSTEMVVPSILTSITSSAKIFSRFSLFHLFFFLPRKIFRPLLDNSLFSSSTHQKVSLSSYLRFPDSPLCTFNDTGSGSHPLNLIYTDCLLFFSTTEWGEAVILQKNKTAEKSFVCQGSRSSRVSVRQPGFLPFV